MVEASSEISSLPAHCPQVPGTSPFPAPAWLKVAKLQCSWFHIASSTIVWNTVWVDVGHSYGFLFPGPIVLCCSFSRCLDLDVSYLLSWFLVASGRKTSSVTFSTLWLGLSLFWLQFLSTWFWFGVLWPIWKDELFSHYFIFPEPLLYISFLKV